MKIDIDLCDFCWNDDGKLVVAKTHYKSDDGRVDVCTRHTKLVKEAGIETSEIDLPEPPLW